MTAVTSIDNNSESMALDWLKTASKAAMVAQLQIFAVRLLQLMAQILAFWFFSGLIHTVIVWELTVSQKDLLPFLFSASVWAGCVWLADTLSYRAKFTLELNFEAQLHDLLQSKQLSVTRQYSTAYWQQLLLMHLNDVGDYLTQYSVQKWLSGMVPLAVLVVILPVNYVVAISLLLTLPVVPLFMVLIGKGTAALHRKHFVALERLGDMFSDRLKALSLITSTHQHPHQLKRLDSASRIVNRKTMSVVSVAFLNNTVLDFFSTVSIAVVAVFIGFTMLGELNFGPVISLHQGLFMLLVAPLLFAELRMLGKLYHQKAKAEAAAECFATLFQEITSADVATQQETIDWLDFSVERPKLHADQLQVTPGQWIRLTGVSGSGKTAFLEAVMGFRVASHHLKGSVALLSQQSCVLDESLAFNLHLGHEGYSDDALVEVLGEVGLTSWFQSLAEGLNTPLGDYPAMSGGETQRLALARVLLLKKEIVLLDEPTAHLTEELHEQLIQLIHRQLRDKTVIWASHKPLPDDWFDQYWQVAHGEIEVLQ